MELYLTNNRIINSNLSEQFNIKYWTDLRIGKKKLVDHLIDTFSNYELKILEKDIDARTFSNEKKISAISLCLFAEDLKKLKDYVHFLEQSYVSVLAGEEGANIFYGSLSDYLNSKYLKISLPEEILNLNSIQSLEYFLANNHDSRAHNKLTFSKNIYTKTSVDKKKLKSEFTFLKNVPQELFQWYPMVYEYHETTVDASYTMKSYPFKDLSYLLLSDSIDEKDFKNLFGFLVEYFSKSIIKDEKESFNVQIDFDKMIDKNLERFKIFESLNFYPEINRVFKFHTNYSLENHFEKLMKSLKNYNTVYCQPNPIFSHGDLCFSNILYDKDQKSFILVDPKGFENKGIRSPYYDLAKISHSIMGDYDLILNGKTELMIADNLSLQLVSKKNKGVKHAKENFPKMIEKIGFDYNLVRLIESSLFLSMIPLHKEDTFRCLKFSLQSYLIYKDLGI